MSILFAKGDVLEVMVMFQFVCPERARVLRSFQQLFSECGGKSGNRVYLRMVVAGLPR